MRGGMSLTAAQTLTLIVFAALVWFAAALFIRFVISITTATATILDGVAMSAFPDLYGPDRHVMGAGAIWLLWAIGVASALATFTTVREAHGQ
jgi:hypothetical protein